uniref:Uncharacterized protein n=1 Tax=Caenorhabditis japonica TaxID=281687 RepID=A0A8R1DIW7_CAEJA
MSCPICKLERQFVDKIINYASLNMVEEIDDKPVDTLRKWWNGQVGGVLAQWPLLKCAPLNTILANFGSGVCPECSSYTENLRICLKCENEQPVKRMANLGVLWHAVCKNSLPPSSIVMCATCAIENHDHDGYKPKKLKEVEMCEDKEAHHLVSNIHYLSTDLVEILCDNVWNNLESTKGANCKLRWMRMMRTCEVAMHLAKVQAKVIFSKANEILSEFSRFFKPLYDVEDEYEYEKDPELINRLIDSLEVQWNTFKADISKTESTIECECTALWKQMAKLKLNNAADQSFAEIVMNTSLEANISGCLLHLDTSSHLLNQLMEFGSKQFSNLNIHLLPSVFCWGTESTCGVISDLQHFIKVKLSRSTWVSQL